ncbi:MAG: GPR endopeptidase [Clostridia bacterium]|nr:GPR endopeptidase [Clostridia bacterium]
MNFRTDLAIEQHESLENKMYAGIKTKLFKKGSVKITRITVTDDEGAQALMKPQGTYITAEIPPLTKYNNTESEIIDVLSQELKGLLPPKGLVLTVGLGNQNITPDALGPESCNLILATRHISGELAECAGLGSLRPSAVFSTGVLGQTGVETAEVIKGLVKLLNPCAVIVIDALAARRLSRLGCTVQMSDAGIIPGSGVGNRRSAINSSVLGVPVISIGVPTVVDALTLASDLSEKEIEENDESKNMIITPREIDLVISRGARLVALTVNKVLQPHISTDEMLSIVTSV